MDRKILQPINLKGNVAENWRTWKQRFEIYATAVELDKKEEKIQCTQLLHQLGEECIKIYNSFNFQEEEKNKITVLKQKFEDHFVPKKNKIYERYKFFSARQEDKTLEQFITYLKNQADQCEFGEVKLTEELTTIK